MGDAMIAEPTLLDAVDALTNPTKTAHWQSGHEHEWKACSGWHGLNRCNVFDCELLVCQWCGATGEDGGQDLPTVVHRMDAALLEQLRAAITSDIGGNSGSGRQARERTPLDVGAFTLYEDIDGRIRSWMVELDAKPGVALTAEQVLRSWYTLWMATNPEPAQEDRRTRVLEGWARQIRDKLAPPKRIEITSPCPMCGREWINVGLKLDDGSDDPDDVERVHVLTAVERESLDDSYALCAACETVWRGVTQLRALRNAIDDAEAS